MTIQTELDFDGVTFDRVKDSARLSTQLFAVKSLMMDSKWRTLSEIAEHVKGSEAGISARLRDMRKMKNGGWIVERRRRTQGTFEYRLVSPDWYYATH